MREKLPARRVKVQVIRLLTLLLTFASLLSACMSSLQLPIQALPGYRLSVFASGNTSYQNPDGVAVDQGHVFLDYQNVTEKDGSDHKTSTVVEYSMSGQRLREFNIPGHSDGLRVDPTTHLLWALSNENKNPILTIIDPASQEPLSEYTFSPPAHEGGYDDLYFLRSGQHPFLSASNPTLDKHGKNKYPSVYQVTNLKPGHPGHVDVAPILMGGASATDVRTKATVTLNEVDPDALTTDTQGDLILINQIGSELIYITHPGTPRQKVRRLGVGTQIDDTVWIPSIRGRLLIVDASRNQTYWMDTTFKPGTVYTETYADSSVQSVVGQLNPDTGTFTVVATGFLKPTGLLFIPS